MTRHGDREARHSPAAAWLWVTRGEAPYREDYVVCWRAASGVGRAGIAAIPDKDAYQCQVCHSEWSIHVAALRECRRQGLVQEGIPCRP